MNRIAGSKKDPNWATECNKGTVGSGRQEVWWGTKEIYEVVKKNWLDNKEEMHKHRNTFTGDTGGGWLCVKALQISIRIQKDKAEAFQAF